MKKEEKTKLTREKIIQAAIFEFGTKSYDAASLNSICFTNQIAKGLFYHNFKSKDELYLKCVEICFEKMIVNLKEMDCIEGDFQTKLKELIKARQSFFADNPYFQHIFFQSTLTPPKHLQEGLKQLRERYNKCLKERFQSLLKEVEFREGVSMEKALSYLMVFQEMYNRYFRTMYDEIKDMNTLIEEHETKITQLLDIVIYGFVKE